VNAFVLPVIPGILLLSVMNIPILRKITELIIKSENIQIDRKFQRKGLVLYIFAECPWKSLGRLETIDFERLWFGIEEFCPLMELLHFQVEITTLTASKFNYKFGFSISLLGKASESTLV
jgi:hypothetical protein